MVNIRPAEPDDDERIIALRAQAFNINEHGQEAMRQDPRIDEVMVAELDGRVVGTTRSIPMGHFFGGRAIDAGGVSGVAVGAGARGRGIGSAMIREQARLQRPQMPIASLYPATVPIYRSAGYGFGGIRTFWKVRLDALPQGGRLDVEPMEDGALEDVNATYEQLAAGTNGLIRRSESWWRK